MSQKKDETRIRVDLKYGSYVSFAAADIQKAYDLYEREGLRVRFCRDIFDDGEIIDSKEPLVEDRTLPQKWQVN